MKSSFERYPGLWIVGAMLLLGVSPALVAGSLHLLMEYWLVLLAVLTALSTAVLVGRMMCVYVCATERCAFCSLLRT